MLEYIIFGFPTALTLSLLSFFAVTEPIEATVERIGVAESYQQAGYSEEHMRLRLHSELETITRVNGSWINDKRIRVGEMKSGPEALADSLYSLDDIVESGLRAFDIIDYIVEVDFLEGPTGTLLAYVQFRDAFTGDYSADTSLSAEVTGEDKVLEPAAVDTLVAAVARYIVQTAEPYIYSAYLYTEALAGRVEIVEVLRLVDIKIREARDRDLPWLLNLRGLVAAHAGVDAYAIRNFADAIRADPQFGPAYLNWGRIWHRRGDLARAEELYREGLRRSSQKPIGYLYLAELQRDFGHDDEAMLLLEAAISLEPNLAMAHELEADIYLRRGEQGHARVKMRRAQLALRAEPNQSRFEPY